MNVVCSSWSIWIIHLACRVRSRALNGRTRTATLTDVIFRMTIFFGTTKLNIEKKKKKKKKTKNVWLSTIVFGFFFAHENRCRKRYRRTGKRTYRSWVHSFIYSPFVDKDLSILLTHNKAKIRRRSSKKQSALEKGKKQI